MRSFISFKIFLLVVLSISGIGYAQSTILPHTGSIQFYTVPPTVTTLHVECYGAQGGDGQDNLTSPGGLGAFISADIAVTPGEQLVIVVGGAGGDAVSPVHGGGGGGGSFVIRDTGYIPLIVAGGGGGGCYEPGSPGAYGSTTTGGGAGGHLSASVGEGGLTSGVGGYGAGGGGWNSDGMSNTWAIGGGMQGGAGGNSLAPALDGGFGGGGAGFQGGGGGGGYTGGGGGNWYIGAGGGGSYNTGLNQVNVQSTLSGDGLVILTPTCVPLIASPVTSISLCEGSSVTLNASSTTGGTVTWDNGITNNLAFDPPVGTNIYTASSSSTNDCGYSVTVDVIAGPVLAIEAAPEMICFGQEQITLIGSGADILTWSSGIQNGVPFDPPVGTSNYFLTGTDTATGCISMETFSVYASDPTIIGSTTTEEIFGNDGEITIDVANAVPPLTFDWDNDGTGDFDDPQNLVSIPGGVYNVVVKDSIGCTVSGAYTVDSQLSVLDAEHINFEVYPNPAQDILNINSQDVFQVEITDARGRSILTYTGQNSYQIEVSDFENGLYFARVKSATSEHVIRFVKQ